MLFRILCIIWNYFFVPTLPLRFKRVIISKTNQIGDVILGLPLASALKKMDATCQIVFLGRGYTKAVIDLYADVDEYADIADGIPAADIIIHLSQDTAVLEAAYKANIPVRIASGRKFAAWRTCNHLLNISRKGSNLHEAQLDLKFCQKFGQTRSHGKKDIIDLWNFRSTEGAMEGPKGAKGAKGAKRIILHPKTKGNHIEWPMTRYSELIHLLPEDRYTIFITGSSAEGREIRSGIPQKANVYDLTGKTTLEELIQHIASCDALIGASTGPVHLAAALNRNTLGLYSQKQPQYAVRWGPLGAKADVITAPVLCDPCRGVISGPCVCLESISAERVYQWLEGLNVSA